MAFEGSGLEVPALRWLGLRLSPVISIPETSRQPFSRHDNVKCQALIEYCQQHVHLLTVYVLNVVKDLVVYANELEAMQQGNIPNTRQCIRLYRIHGRRLKLLIHI